MGWSSGAEGVTHPLFSLLVCVCVECCNDGPFLPLPYQLSCCGVVNYTDWYNVTWNASCPSNTSDKCVPLSCCTETAMKNNTCKVMTSDPANTYFKVVSGVGGWDVGGYE